MIRVITEERAKELRETEHLGVALADAAWDDRWNDRAEVRRLLNGPWNE